MEDDYFLKSYSLCQRHIDYLEEVNKSSHSQALRTSIDKLIKQDKSKTKRQKLDTFKDNIVIIAIGMIFLLFGMASTNLLTIITALGIGIFFATYGIITIKVKET
jgi:hypothetical protein